MNRKNYVDELDNWEFLRRFCLTIETFAVLLGEIEEVIKSRTNRNNAVRPTTKLLWFLRFLATRTMLLAMADFAGVSKSAAQVIII